jgi:hypothetical protein
MPKVLNIDEIKSRYDGDGSSSRIRSQMTLSQLSPESCCRTARIGMRFTVKRGS